MMMREQLRWGIIGALALAGLLLVSDALAQVGSFSNTYRTMGRGEIGVSVYASGALGRQDNAQKQEPHSFSYPKQHHPLVYAGGLDRAGWWISHNTGGDGVWILSRTGGTPRVSHSGGQSYTSDIRMATYDPAAGPEKNLGTPYDYTHPLALRSSSNGVWHGGVALDGQLTNYWPGATIPAGHPPMIWNFGYYKYNSKEAAAFPQEIGISRWSTGAGLTITRKGYMFGHQDYDDSVIFDYVVENTSGKDITDAYISFQSRIDNSFGSIWRISNWHAPADGNRDAWLRNTRAANFSGPASARDLALMYAFDGDDPQVPWDDRGDPWLKDQSLAAFKSTQDLPDGMLLSGVYFGYGLIDALPPFNIPGGADPDTYVAPRDNPATPLDESKSQPAATQWYRMTTVSQYDAPNEGKNSDAIMYDMLTSGGHKEDPTEMYAYNEFMTFGPYDLKAGEKFKVVMAYAGGLAAQNPKYLNQPSKYPQPFEWAWMMMGLQSELTLGEDAMLANFRKAMEAYTWSYAVPQQPPDIKLRWDSNLKGQAVLKWSGMAEDSENPAYAGTAEAKDIVGYRVYASYREARGPYTLKADFKVADAKAGKLPANVTFDPNEQWRTNKSATFPDGVALVDDRGQAVKGTYSYTDADSKAGFPAWYSVRAYTAGHSDFMGRGKTPSTEGSLDMVFATAGWTGGVVPNVPSSPLFDQFAEKVKVVPNPFRVDDPQRTYKDRQGIRFTNLPKRAQIDIYDVTGQRIWTWFHDSITSGESTYLQLTEGRPSTFGEAMVPGIYFWQVTSLMPESMKKTQQGTFLIIK